MISLDSPIATVLGDASTKRAKIEKNLGLRTVGDLLAHHPRRYLRKGELTGVDELEEGQILTVVGEIAQSRPKTYADRRSGQTAYRLDTLLRTGGPSLRMSFFAKKQRVAKWHAQRLAEGTRGVFTGQVGRFQGEWQLTNPRMTLFGGQEEEPDDASRAVLETDSALYPLYALTAGVDSWDLQRAVSFARTVIDEVPELVPEAVRREHRLVDARTALDWIHSPDDWDQVAAAQRRYRFDEALVTQLVLARRRAFVRAIGTPARDGGHGRLLTAFDARLPFELTAGQREVGETLSAELARPHPMHRLLQGEVGSGKTVVALRAMLRVIDSGGQAALLAPTEVLAAQHHRSISALLGDLASGGMLGGAEEGTTVALLTGSMSRTARAESLLRIASGEAGIVIGTHALLQDPVSFADLALVVVDEQHRFGVEQRAALTDKAASPPHVLVMTATPIPRTVAMTVFGDLETATLTELPAGRMGVRTVVVPLTEQPRWVDRIWDRVREEVELGRQVYVVCPRISGDEAEQGETDQVDVDEDGSALAFPEGTLAAVEEVAAALESGPLARVAVRVLHGRLTPEVKDSTMRAFADGEVEVLVATTVIEVGVDVGNATTMVVLDADRFGVSQLHQLRGRVGRGTWPGLCLLVTRAARPSPARDRLDAVAATTDGVALSRVDLEQRREGDVLGRSQSGFRSSLQSLRVLRDEETIVAARHAAEQLLDADPDLTSWPDLEAAVVELDRSQRSGFMEKS